MKTNIWNEYKNEKRDELEKFIKEYKQFLDNSKTERESVLTTIEMAERAGFVNLNTLIKNKTKLKCGDKVYATNMDKAMVLFNLGSLPLEKGMTIVGSHIDSPRLDLKAIPIYENNGLCMFDTHYYGGIKHYQWVALPLALHGVVVKKDGSKIYITIGENENEPVFGITDLLPHLEREIKDKINIKGEDLNILVGSIADEHAEKDKVKCNILNILKQKYNILEQDLFSAEIEVVPAGKARNFGLDESMVMGYGQDDRVCAFTSVKAMLETTNLQHSAMCILVDKEEIGSVGATAMNSKFFENLIAEIMELSGQYNELDLRRCFFNSKMLSCDVTAAYDPNYPTPMNAETDAHFARGISFNKYTGSRGKNGANDANPEFIAALRNALDKNNVNYQATEMGKVDAGGGGTIAFIMAEYGMDVIDAGVPLLNMHAPWEIACKTDIYESYKCYSVFYSMLDENGENKC